MRALCTAAVLVAACGASVRTGLYGLNNVTQLFYQSLAGPTIPLGSPLPASESIAQELSCVDQHNGIFYTLGYNQLQQRSNLVGQNMLTGAVVSTVDVPFFVASFVGTAETLSWDPVTGNLLATGMTYSNGTFQTGWLSPSTGEFSPVGTVPVSAEALMSSCYAFDPATRDLVSTWFDTLTNDSSIISTNSATGAVVQWDEPFGKGLMLDSMDYDRGTGLVYGLGMHVNATHIGPRTLVALNTVTHIASLVGNIPGYQVIDSDLTALDPVSRTLYFAAQKTGAGQNDPFDLVGVSLHDASVKSVIQLCATYDYCPWTIEWLSALYV